METVYQSPLQISLAEGHVLVRAEESHELWGSINSDGTSSVNIEMSPCLGEVGIEVGLEGGTAESLMGAEDLGGSGSHGGFVHDEFTAWDWVFVLTSAVLIDGVVVEH